MTDLETKKRDRPHAQHTDVRYTSIPVLETNFDRASESHGRASFTKFMKTPPFHYAMYDTSLRYVKGDPFPDTIPDPVWLNRCNEFIMGLDRRDSILIAGYEPDVYAKAGGGSESKMDVKDECIIDATRNSQIDAIKALILCLAKHRHGINNDISPTGTDHAFIGEQFTKTPSSEFCRRICRLLDNRIEHFKKKKNRLDQYILIDKDDIMESMKMLNAAGAEDLFVHHIAASSVLREKHKSLSEPVEFMHATRGFAFQYIDLLDNAIKKGTAADLFHTDAFNLRDALAADIAAFKKTRSAATRFEIFTKYAYYFRASRYLDEVVRAGFERFNRICRELPPLRKPLVVYMGVRNSAYLKRRTWPGPTMTTLNAYDAISDIGDSYAKCCLARITIPAGNRVLLLPATGNELRIALPHMTQVAKAAATESPTLTHVHDAYWPLLGMARRGDPMWVYDLVVQEKTI
jgi:hypothetical protein